MPLPANQPTNSTNATPQQDVHPALHNDANDAINKLADLWRVTTVPGVLAGGWSGNITFRRVGSLVTAQFLMSRASADLAYDAGIGVCPGSVQPGPGYSANGVLAYRRGLADEAGITLPVNINPGDGAIRLRAGATSIVQIIGEMTYTCQIV